MSTKQQLSHHGIGSGCSTNGNVNHLTRRLGRSSVNGNGPGGITRGRKMSVPVLLYGGTHKLGIAGQHPSLGTPGTRGHSVDDSGTLNKRRLSNVGDAVSRKLSSTMGWRSHTAQEVIAETKKLCGQFVRARLNRSGISHKKMGLQRMSSMARIPLGETEVISEVFADLNIIGTELERMYPKLYIGVCKQVAVTITNEKSVRGVLNSIGQELFKADITWSKIISLYCVAGGLAVDCVQSGHPEYLFDIIETMAMVIERDAAVWVVQQGGWPGLLSHQRPPDVDSAAFQNIASTVLSLILLVVIMIILLRLIGSMAFG